MNDIASWLRESALWLLLVLGTVFTFVWVVAQRKKLKTVWYACE